MPHYCEWADGCGRPGIYKLYTTNLQPRSINVCDHHRAVWVNTLRRRVNWPCAIEGCKRVARPGQDGLCEYCWVVVRAHDRLVEELGGVEPALKALAVRHVVRPEVSDTPTEEEVKTAARSVEGLTRQLDAMRHVQRALAAMRPRMPQDLSDELEAACLSISAAVDRAKLIARVEIAADDKPQRSLFDVR